MEPAASETNTVTCNYCPKEFQHKYSLRRHVKVVHSGYKPHSCECGKTFATKEQLVRHQNAKHTFSRPFKCERGCEKAFASNSARIYHHNVVHDNKKFRCPLLICPKEYSSRGHLNQHLKKPHEPFILRVNEINWLADLIEEA